MCSSRALTMPKTRPRHAFFAFERERQRAPRPRPSTTLNDFNMEFLNRIELRGVVGRADVNSYNGSHVCNFSVVTEASAVDREGNSTVEPTWFNVSAWSGVRGITDLSQIQKGNWVRVIGRLRTRKYVSQDGLERISVEIPARIVELIPREEEREQMQPQRDY